MGAIRENVYDFGKAVNKVNQYGVGILMALLIIDVWVGVADRYLFHWQLSWVEELARYIMIWGILLAVPCCTFGREHMGLEFVVKRLPLNIQTILKITMSLLMVLFFSYIAYAGIAYMEKGEQQLSTVFALPMSYAYAAIPVTFFLSAFQALIVLIQDISEITNTPNALLGEES